MRSSDGAIEPTPQLVCEIAGKMTGLDQPRFVLLTGLYQRLQLQLKEIQHFQTSLIRAVSQAVKAQHSPLIDPKGSYGTCPESKDGLSSANALNKPQERKNLHWDNGDSCHHTPLNSLSYGLNVGIEGGKPRLGDFAQWLKDTRGKSPSEFKPTELKALYEAYYPVIESDYSITLSELDPDNDIPLLLFNNSNRHDGILHGVTPVTQTAPDARRPLFRVTLSRNGDIRMQEWRQEEAERRRAEYLGFDEATRDALRAKGLEGWYLGTED